MIADCFSQETGAGGEGAGLSVLRLARSGTDRRDFKKQFRSFKGFMIWSCSCDGPPT